MLPKEEKNTKKKSVDTDQPGLFDKEDEKKRLQKKRRFVYIAMFFTVGLSISFWTYHSIKNTDFNFKLPSINLPNFSSSTSPIKTTTNISLPKDSSTWSIFLKPSNSDSVIFQKNQDLIFNSQKLTEILDQINQSNYTTNSVYSSELPQGLKIKEIIQKDDKNLSYFSRITTPSQDLFMLIKISNSTNLDQSIKLIPGFINQLYWYSLEK